MSLLCANHEQEVGLPGEPVYELLGHLLDLATDDTMNGLYEYLAQYPPHESGSHGPQTFCGEPRVRVDPKQLEYACDAEQNGDMLTMECHDLVSTGYDETQIQAITDSMFMKPGLFPEGVPSNTTVFMVTRLHKAHRFHLEWKDSHGSRVPTAVVNLPVDAQVEANADGSCDCYFPDSPADYGFECVVLDRVTATQNLAGYSCLPLFLDRMDLQPLLFPQVFLRYSSMY